WPIFVLPMVLFSWLHAEISPADAVVRPQSLVVALERDAARFENVAVVGGFKCLRHTLFDQQDREVRLPADFDQPLKDEIRDRWREAHRGLIQHQEFRRGGEPAADRQHLLLPARERAWPLAAALSQHTQPIETASTI